VYVLVHEFYPWKLNLSFQSLTDKL
jgi:hypothetical protein